MGSTAIVTDTDCSLPPSLAEPLGIRQVAITVHFEEEVLQSGIDIDDEELFARIDRDGVLPTTAAPSPGRFAEAFRQALDGGADSILCFCVSSQVSATYEAAVTARQTMGEESIQVVDTQSLAMGQGFMVLAAAEAVRAGATPDEAVAKALDVGGRTHLYAALPTLKYLAMSGRVGSVAAGVADVLSIKPLLTIQEGKLDLLERVRTESRAWDRLLELIGESLQGRAIERLAIIHVAARDKAGAFQERLCEVVHCPDTVLVTGLTPGLSVHAGSGIVGAAYVLTPNAETESG